MKSPLDLLQSLPFLTWGTNSMLGSPCTTLLSRCTLHLIGTGHETNRSTLVCVSSYFSSQSGFREQTRLQISHPHPGVREAPFQKGHLFQGLTYHILAAVCLRVSILEPNSMKSVFNCIWYAKTKDLFFPLWFPAGVRDEQSPISQSKRKGLGSTS